MYVNVQPTNKLALCTLAVIPLHREAIVKLTDGFNGADLRNVCTEAGMFAIRAERPYTIEEDFLKAARKVSDSKKLEGKMEYEKV